MASKAPAKQGEVSKKPKTRKKTIQAPKKTTKASSNVNNIVVKSISEANEQLSFVYGVLEELCERQEAMAAWQSAWMHQLVKICTTQLNYLEQLSNPNGATTHIETKVFSQTIEESSTDFQKLLEDLGKKGIQRRKKGMGLTKKIHSKNIDKLNQNDTEPGKLEEIDPPVFIIPHKNECH